MQRYKFLKGPVNSRRLGISLGVNTIPYKVCPFDCIYCECGKTTNLSCKEQKFFNPNKIIHEIDDYFKNGGKADFITFSGSGEPMLYIEIEKIINHIQENYRDIKLALISCAYNIDDEKIQNIIKKVDVFMPSLDAAFEETFQKLNRPHKDIKLKNIISGLIHFSKIFKGKIWLEIFFVEDLNDSEEELAKFYEILKEINPDVVHLNSLDRNSTEKWVKKISIEKLHEIKDYFKDLNCHIV